MAPIASKCLQTSPNGSLWQQTGPNGTKWLQMAPNGSKWLQISPFGFKLLQVAPKVPKWPHSCWKWSIMVLFGLILSNMGHMLTLNLSNCVQDNQVFLSVYLIRWISAIILVRARQLKCWWWSWSVESLTLMGLHRLVNICYQLQFISTRKIAFFYNPN